MSQTITLNVPLNRVEGDLDIRVEVEDGIVRDVWSSGIMYRGFEKIMVGRGALGGLVITPRICGICSTGHLAAAAQALDMIAGNSLFTDLIGRDGPTVFSRQLARLVRSVEVIPAMEMWLSETSGEGQFYVSPGDMEEGEGFGLVHAARGALGHWVRIDKGAIEHYQIITPTAWHASPRDSNDTRGPWAEALIGVEIKDPDNPIELGHVIRSFDACLVCTVHTVNRGQSRGRTTWGAALPWWMETAEVCKRAFFDGFVWVTKLLHNRN